ncbi:MAG: 6-phosphofructokinase [Abditibacteriota bacterium]|nr:6-phosphofructokinase [Abditibacteriota bacterium]
MSKKIKKIGVLTSGGDAPGMNAAIRGVVRTAISNDVDVYGIHWGYQGLMEGKIEQMNARDVSGFGSLGGTKLGSARSPEFKTEEGIKKAIEYLKAFEIEGLVVIGGDGSLRGAMDLHNRGIKVVGIPASIDNDIAHTDFSIGSDTALNTILDALDKIRDTASAHYRGFVLEVMGNKNGYLALTSGTAGGAELIIVPSTKIDKDKIIHQIKSAFLRKKSSFIAVCAEGASTPEQNISDLIVSYIKEAGFECRKTVLGHVQRGGKPTGRDRILGNAFGHAAVIQLIKGNSGIMVGDVGNNIECTPIPKVCEDTKNIKLPKEVLDVIDDLMI